MNILVAKLEKDLAQPTFRGLHPYF